MTSFGGHFGILPIKKVAYGSSVATTLESFLSNPLIRIINKIQRETTFIGKPLNI